MKKKWSVIAVIFVACICVFAIPLIVDKFIIGNSVPSNLTNSEWASFLGGYIATIIGTTTSLVGIIFTILYSNKQNKLDRQLQVSPYLAGIFTKVETPIRTNGGIIRAILMDIGYVRKN